MKYAIVFIYWSSPDEPGFSLETVRTKTGARRDATAALRLRRLWRRGSSSPVGVPRRKAIRLRALAGVVQHGFNWSQQVREEEDRRSSVLFLLQLNGSEDGV